MAENIDGIALIAKQSGISSFSSLWQVKNALQTKKIGHTGTLDTFADGLLVALTGRLTRLAPYVTQCDKEYYASISFGAETDTLDPDGEICATGPLPTLGAIQSVLPELTGQILQVPPSYSALRCAGKRASDRVRGGESLNLPPRPVSVYDIAIMAAFTENNKGADDDSTVSRLDISVRCSKGTYVRSLARDIAHLTGSRAHLVNLRRTRIGPFSLKDAAGLSLLPAFGVGRPASFGKGDKPPEIPGSEILERVLGFTPELAEIIGLSSIQISPARKRSFSQGQRLQRSWFDADMGAVAVPETRAVFAEKDFLGMIRLAPDSLTYDFVLRDDTCA